MPGSLSRQAKLIPLIGGFLFGTVGAVWSFVFVERQGEEIKRLSRQGPRPRLLGSQRAAAGPVRRTQGAQPGYQISQ